MRNQFKRGLSAVGIAAVMAMSALPAHAELPAAIATETAAAKTDVKEMGALILGVVITIAAVGWLRRVAK